MSVKQKLKLGMAYFGVFLTVVTMSQFVTFLSFLPADSPSTPGVEEDLTGTWTSFQTAWALFWDLSYICLFMFLHSAVADTTVKNMYAKLGLQDIERCIYIIISCISLQVLMHAWQPTPWAVLWNFDVKSNQVLWWLYTVLHTHVWVIIYIGNILLDAAELLGIKQVEYSTTGLPSPDSYKSASLKRLREHMSHSAILGFSLIFWIYPYMRLDRVLLAVVLQLYMFLSWVTTQQDAHYLHQQLEKKMYHLN